MNLSVMVKSQQTDYHNVLNMKYDNKFLAFACDEGDQMIEASTITWFAQT